MLDCGRPRFRKKHLGAVPISDKADLPQHRLGMHLRPYGLSRGDGGAVAEIARRFGKTPHGVRDAADRGRLPHDVVLHGKKKERRFPKSVIDNLDAWPGYGTVPASGSAEDHLTREVERLRGRTPISIGTSRSRPPDVPQLR